MTETKHRQDGRDNISWTASEYIQHSRGAGWYLSLILATIVLTVGFYFLLDITAAIVVAILGTVVAFTAGRKPREIDYMLSPNGLGVGQKFYSFSEFKSYSITREGLLSSLVFTPLKRFVPPISVYFEADREEDIIQIVSEHLPIERRGPDKIDSLSRRLRF